MAQPSVTAQIKERFLTALRRGGRVEACARILLPRLRHPSQALYKERRRDPEFRAAWDRATALAAPRAAAAAAQRESTDLQDGHGRAQKVSHVTE